MTASGFTTKRLAVRDTGPARLPGLAAPPATGNAALDSWIKAASEHIEVRAGSRGNPWERSVTVREFAALSKDVEKATSVVDALDTLANGGTPTSGEASRMIEAFIKSIKSLQVYKDLIKRLDDPSRFDNLPAEIREQLLASLAEEAAKLGAAITRVEKIMQDANRSLSFEIKTVTAAVQQAQAGVREVSFATAEANFAQAGKITQLEASLGNFYQDGTPGRALLEEQMTVTADRVAGLSAQYTIKVQAGGAVAGIGLAATEVNGEPTSAMIIAADKFAIVNPSTYTNGLTNTPDPAHIPFGVDAYGIYMNTNVYVRGNMRVDAGGKTLADGMRGSVMIDGGSGAWSDSVARTAVWTYLGKTGAPSNNNHLVIGDMVTIGGVSRQWNGSVWTVPGVVINGDLLVDGSVAANKIDTYGLVIRDEYGNPILGAGYSLPTAYITGLGAMATAPYATIGSTVKFPNGATLNTWDFVNSLSKINSGNISVFMDGAAITNAYIGNAAVGTLQVAGGSITTMVYGDKGYTAVGSGVEYAGARATIVMPSGSSGVVATGTIQVTAPGSDTHVLTMSIVRENAWGTVDATLASVGISVVGGKTYTHTLSGIDSSPTSLGYYSIRVSADSGRTLAYDRSSITVVGGKR